MFQGNNHHNTALHRAAQNGFDEVAEKLLRAKRINVNKKDLHANTALHLAAQNGQIGVNLETVHKLQHTILGIFKPSPSPPLGLYALILVPLPQEQSFPSLNLD